MNTERSALCRYCAVILGLFVWCVYSASAHDGLPEGFVDELVTKSFVKPVGLTFDANGRMYVWERRGFVYIYENGAKQEPPLLNLREEVGVWGDHGLLGFTLDPNFLSNGYLYLFYVVDRHHLLYYGTDQYDPDVDENFNATIGRITRYTADASTGFTTILPDSRRVILGEKMERGIPILYKSHGTGSLWFGEDGTLLASAGDGAIHDDVDTGSHPNSYYAQALADKIIRPEENVGAFRSQMIGSLNGKILRLDPKSGNGIPSNPFYDPARPRAPQSRIFALGLRNPFRCSLRPGTGSGDPDAARPGAIYVGDVGWGTWEDFSVVTEPGQNLGWPLYEGLEPLAVYMERLTKNLDAPNPLSCGIPYFRFQDLLAQEVADHHPSFPNPCDPEEQIDPSTPTFMHRRPVLDFRHGFDIARTGVFVGNDAAVSVLGDPGCPVQGEPFGGKCSVSGVWHSGRGFPAEYQDSYYHCDFPTSWIRRFRFDAFDRPVEAFEFALVHSILFLCEDPSDGSLLYCSWTDSEIRRIRYTGDSNLPPKAVLRKSSGWGPSPFYVLFDASGSSDPEGSALQYAWDFGDGKSSDALNPSHTYISSTRRTYTVTLTVRDSAGATATDSAVVSINNSPPRVSITSFLGGRFYSTTKDTELSLEAIVQDDEDPPSLLSYRWETFLHHDTHYHAEDVSYDPVSSTTLSPTPTDGIFYAYRIALTVTDPLGISTTVEAWLYPDCSGVPSSVELTSPVRNARYVPDSAVRMAANVATPAQRVEFFANELLVNVDSSPPFEVTWSEKLPGSYTLSALAILRDGSSVSSRGFPVSILPREVTISRVLEGIDDAEENVGNGTTNLTSGDLELTNDPSSGNQIVGLRFPLRVPKGVIIRAAHLQFVVDETSSAAAELKLHAQDRDDAPAISGNRHDLSQRRVTKSSVLWTPEPWISVGDAEPAQRSPDLSPVVQELIDREGWEPGNHVLWLVTGSGRRTAESVDGSKFQAPVLYVEYEFDARNLPPSVDAGADQLVLFPATGALHGIATDDGVIVPLEWTVVSGLGWVTFSRPNSPDTEAVFEKVGDYVLRLTAKDENGTVHDDVLIEVVDDELYEVIAQIVSGNDDAEEGAQGDISVSSTDLELVEDGSRGSQIVGLRFPLNVPRFVTIESAFVQFRADETSSSACALLVHGEASDDAAPIKLNSFNLSSRSVTSSSVTWSPAPWVSEDEEGFDQRTPDLKGVVQEVVNRPGWTSGNEILILLRGSGKRTAQAYDGKSAPTLTVHYRY